MVLSKRNSRPKHWINGEFFLFWGGRENMEHWKLKFGKVFVFWCLVLWENLVRGNFLQPKLFKKPHKNGGGGRRFCWKDGRIFELSFFLFFLISITLTVTGYRCFSPFCWWNGPLLNHHDFLGVATACTCGTWGRPWQTKIQDASNNCTFFDRTCLF